MEITRKYDGDMIFGIMEVKWVHNQETDGIFFAIEKVGCFVVKNTPTGFIAGENRGWVGLYFLGSRASDNGVYPEIWVPHFRLYIWMIELPLQGISLHCDPFCMNGKSSKTWCG